MHTLTPLEALSFTVAQIILATKKTVPVASLTDQQLILCYNHATTTKVTNPTGHKVYLSFVFRDKSSITLMLSNK